MNADRPRVVLVGLGPTTADALAGLLAETEVVALVRPGNDDVVAAARAAAVPVIDDDRVPVVRDAVARTRPDCVVVSSFHRILPADLVDACPFVNVHYAPLPRLRGRATVNWAIINGETEATISVHRLVPGLDAGGILHAEQVPIGPRDTVDDVYAALNRVQRRVLPAVVPPAPPTCSPATACSGCAGSRGTAASRSPPPSWSVRSAPPSGCAPPISSGGCASSGADSYFGRASPGSVTGVPLLVNPTLETTGVAPADPVSVSWYCR